MAGKSTVPTNFSGTRSAKPFGGTSIGLHFWHHQLRLLFVFLQVPKRALLLVWQQPVVL